MNIKVTDRGIVIPRSLLEGITEVEIRKENNMILIIPVKAYTDPIFELGKAPVEDDLKDASVHHDQYLYD